MGEFGSDVRKAVRVITERPMIVLWPMLFVDLPALALFALLRSDPDRPRLALLAFVPLLVLGFGFLGAQRVLFVRPLSAGEVWRAVRTHAPKFGFVAVLCGVVLYVTALVHREPAAIEVYACALFALMTYVSPALVFERGSPFRAVGRGVRLLFANFGAALPYVSMPVVLLLVLAGTRDPDSLRATFVITVFWQVALTVLRGATVFHYRRIAY